MEGGERGERRGGPPSAISGLDSSSIARLDSWGRFFKFQLLPISYRLPVEFHRSVSPRIVETPSTVHLSMPPFAQIRLSAFEKNEFISMDRNDDGRDKETKKGKKKDVSR